MPKLSSENAKKVAEVEDNGGGGNYGPIPEGKYRVRLLEVESAKTAKGAPKWVWKFETTDPAENAGRWLWEHTAIQDSTMWKVRQVFDAFGVPADTDTDDLIGQSIDVMVGVEIAGAGKMKGKEVNTIREFLPASQIQAAATPAAKAEEIPF
jgi:hypothetical protein